MRSLGTSSNAFGIAQRSESVGGHAVGRDEIVGLVEIDIVDVGAGDEGFDRQRLVALRDCGSDLLGIDHDVLAVLDLEALGLVLAFDLLARVTVDENAVHPVAGLLVDRVKRSAFGGAGGRVQTDPATDLAEFDETLPLGTMTGHSKLPT